MCIEDWRLGRLIRSQISAAALTVGQTLSIAPSMQRVGVILSTTAIGIAAGTSETITIDGKIWGLLYTGGNPLIFLLKDHGDLVTKSFVITCGANAANVAITELFLPESVLKERPEELQQE